MKWEKKGLIYKPEGDLWWRQLYAILPTPLLLPEQNRIRIYFATTCKDKFGRVTYVELDADDPSKILYTHNDFILDVGEIGTFDDCGVNVSTILLKDSKYYLYYAGYQRHFRTPFSILSGLAVGDDGINFKRITKVPLLERTDEELNLRSAPTVIFDEGIYKMWYVAGIGWQNIKGDVHNNRLMPVYRLRYAESNNGFTWAFDNKDIFAARDDEFGFGRPFIFKTRDGLYQLYYSVRRASISYRMGMAESTNGRDWVRHDSSIDLNVSAEGWDSEMICYPAVIEVQRRIYMFYNGNRNGESGFGYAELSNY